MSTTELFIPPEELSDLILGTYDDDFLTVYGNDIGDYGVCPYISFYLYHDLDSAINIYQTICDIYDEFAALKDQPYEKIYNHKRDTFSLVKRLRKFSGIRDGGASHLTKKGTLLFGVTDMESESASPRWAFFGTIEEDPYTHYTSVKMVFRNHWYNQHKDRWQQFSESCIERLKPEHCYSGFEISSGPLSIMGNYEAETMERIYANYFYGLDIDHQDCMNRHNHECPDDESLPIWLGAGLRTPTWCFMLSPYWLNKLEKTEVQVRAELDHPDITITAFSYPKNEHNPEGINGLWIQLGELNLHPVVNGKPEHLVKANQLIKPIRCDTLNLTSLCPWDDDPNPRFDYESSIKWMRRFDDDSDWLDQKIEGYPTPETIFNVHSTTNIK